MSSPLWFTDTISYNLHWVRRNRAETQSSAWFEKHNPVHRAEIEGGSQIRNHEEEHESGQHLCDPRADAAGWQLAKPSNIA